MRMFALSAGQAPEPPRLCLWRLTCRKAEDGAFLQVPLWGVLSPYRRIGLWLEGLKPYSWMKESCTLRYNQPV
ncbi:hypothetical protein CUU66_07920 [Peribacillus deserti]|uniref:Uncharacterized protein n=1 Tax=Peribacillus deserti TaxID=673318 RepID=A0A2N5M7Q7_9BACI|nr:hypothetical protein CUU66_07920 [Peribacillus deserti]